MTPGIQAHNAYETDALPTEPRKPTLLSSPKTTQITFSGQRTPVPQLIPWFTNTPGTFSRRCSAPHMKPYIQIFFSIGGRRN